ncbi:MAG: ferric reductase-like transmembrane domain-containing protein [Spirochaetota bacterium]
MAERILALSIFVLLAAVILLAVKGRFMNRHLFTLARQFRLHHLVSLGALVLVLVHVALVFWRDWPDSAGMYLSSTDVPTLAGWAGAGLLATVVASSWISALSWKRWYLVHMLSLPALALSGYHGLSYASGRPADTAALIALFTIIVILLVRIFADRLGRYHSSRYEIIANQHITSRIFELHLVATAPAKTALPAGSIVYLRFDSPGFSRAWHPFSVASSTRDSDLRLMIKALGHDTGQLHKLTAGDHVYIRGPFREFRADFSRPQVWIAGGIGIAPFIGYVSGLEGKSAQRIELFHYTEQPEEALDLSQYLPQAATRPVIHADSHSGLPDLTALLALARELPQAVYTICGPPAFMHYVRKALTNAGTDTANIRTEEFQPW